MRQEYNMSGDDREDVEYGKTVLKLNTVTILITLSLFQYAFLCPQPL